MASKAHITVLREQSLQALKDSHQQIAAALDMEPPNLDLFFRDPDLLHATQLHELATFSQQLVGVVGDLPTQAQVADLQQQLADAQAQFEAFTAGVEAVQSDEDPQPPKPKKERSKKS